jgi:hypothetical protein
MAQPNNIEGSVYVDLLDYIPKVQIELPDDCCNCLSRFVAATEASQQFSAFLTNGSSAIASSSHPVPCTDSNLDRHDMTSITVIISSGNARFFDGCTIEEGAM